MVEHDESLEHSPLERMILGALKAEKRFTFSLDGLEPEDINRILSAFFCVHVFGGKFDESIDGSDGFSAIRRLCEVHQIEPRFEAREYPALKRGKSPGHKIILLPDSGSVEENEKKSLQIIKYFDSLEPVTITETIIGLIEKFDAVDIIKYVEKHNTNLGRQEFDAFKERMLKRQKRGPKPESSEDSGNV